MTDLEGLRDVWERAAQTDPLFAVCTDPSRRHGTWDEAEFFRSGEREVEAVLAHIAGAGISVDFTGHALDFGCGVGRLTRALAGRFGRCVGVDISPTMIHNAQTRNSHLPGCEFILNDGDDLSQIRSGRFGFVYSNIVLQHMEPTYARAYIGEFLRVLKPEGVAVFQIPSAFNISLGGRIRRAMRLRTRLRELLGDRRLEDARVEWEMHSVPEREIHTCVEGFGGRVVDVALTNACLADFDGELRYLEEEPGQGWVSTQYAAVRGSGPDRGHHGVSSTSQELIPRNY